MVSTQQLHAWLVRARAWSGAERAAAAAMVLAGLGLVVWALRLLPEWRVNPELSHGFFAVPIVVMLWLKAREEGGATPGPRGRTVLGVVLVLGVAAAAAAVMATVYAVALGWTASTTLFLLSAVAAAAVGIAGFLAAGRAARWVAVGWPAWVIPAVILLSAPLPPATTARLTGGLQEAITVGVVETLRLVGIPAMRAGNVINLGNTAVGVEEACSGVRSLVSCVLAGLVLSALMPRSKWRRALLVLAAAPLALLMNFLRSLTLTLLAKNGVDIAGFWHDGLGYAVLIVTTVVLAALASALEEKGAWARPVAVWSAAARASWRASAAAGLAGMVAVGGWLGYVAERSWGAKPADVTPPRLAELVPEEPTGGGWMVETRTDLELFAGILLTDHLMERTYVRQDEGGGRTQVTVYVAWWPAEATSVSTVVSHTPEACWPGTGWEMEPKANGPVALMLGDGRVVGDAEERRFRRGDYPQRVWFWHLVGKQPLAPFDPLSWRDQLRYFFRRGVRPKEAQTFLRISSNREWTTIADEPLVRQILAGFESMGVPVMNAGAGAGSASERP
jgi:exosortase